ncbi:PF02656 domain-containing protein [Colletotrichum tofieldiae]|nr:PF02656 domain-containing protein [Colletotrichum tofieldiae]
MAHARDDATAPAAAAAAAPQPPSSDPQQPQSQPAADSPPPPRGLSRRNSYDDGSPASPRSLSRRQSTNERINEILQPPRHYSRADGSHDENVGIISRGPDRNYQSMNANPELLGGMRPRKPAQSARDHLPAPTEAEEESYDDVVAREERARAAQDKEPWYTVFLSSFQSIELENKGSVARDHLALERTFLAWLRTSLAFASIGIAVTQLFRLNSSLSNPDSPDPNAHTLRQLGKPLGATFLAISILILFLGYQRYFRAQQWVMRGKFPASRGTIIIVSLVAFALMAVSLVVVVVVSPTSRER